MSVLIEYNSGHRFPIVDSELRSRFPDNLDAFHPRGKSDPKQQRGERGNA